MRKVYEPGASIQNSPELQGLIRRLNLTRGQYLCGFLLGVLLINFIALPWPASANLRLAFLLLMVVCAIYFCGVAFFKKQILDRPRLVNGLVFVLWGTLMICMTPLFAEDIHLSNVHQSTRPFNLALLAMLLAGLPIFSRRQTLLMYLLLYALNVVMCLCLDASLSYIAFVSALCFGCMMFSLFVQYGYVRMVWQYKIDSCRDELTGILNRKGGLERMRLMLAMARRHEQLLAIYMVDIDHFKEYNDTLGHIQGDVALGMVAQALNRVFVRESDVVCRFGGEEFVICAVIGRLEEAEIMANRLLEAVRALKLPHPGSASGPYLSVSIGYIHHLPPGDQPTQTPEVLIERADLAMYRAKNAGRDRGAGEESGPAAKKHA